jgi:hypothetical protein
VRRGEGHTLAMHTIRFTVRQGGGVRVRGEG